MKMEAIRLLGRRNSGFFTGTEWTIAVYSVVQDRHFVASDPITPANRSSFTDTL